MKCVLIIDGYNVIHGDEMLQKLSEIKLEEAREKLIHLLNGYAGVKGYDIILVFDAYQQQNLSSREEKWGLVKVVYTDKNKTADAYIEKLVYELPKVLDVQVVTSDFTLQRMVLAGGATRIPSRELMEDINKMSETLSSIKKHEKKATERHRLQDFMDEETLEKFNVMRSDD
ncbi:NYN domain-containing protein [Eubacteriaceae bacterium ES3]|nr:NYN domain-containing protein [Eubacteriaceae bacterium ES3]